MKIYVRELEPGMAWIQNGMCFVLISIEDSEYRSHWDSDHMVKAKRLTYYAAPTQAYSSEITPAIITECNKYTKEDAVWLDDYHYKQIT